MKIVFFTFYYPPDLSAGSFRSAALIDALSCQLGANDNLVVITTYPNRYGSYQVNTDTLKIDNNITIYRIKLPKHSSTMFSQSIAFSVYMVKGLITCFKEKPDFLIGTSGRLMTAILTWFSSCVIGKPYAIDLRDIFSETISDIFNKKNKYFGKILKLIFTFFDKLVLKKAACVNLVSKGFLSYFEDRNINTSNWHCYSNGVDDIFINFQNSDTVKTNDKVTILYAGNIGYAQSLEKIIPEIASKLGDKFQFLIVGDGSAKKKLVDKLESMSINNVSLIDPVSQLDLLDYYKKSDILFLHLDNISAFKRVLPSKLFEYAVIGRPIVAGLSGYSIDFSRNHIPHSFIFNPGNVDECIECIHNAMKSVIATKTIDQFIKKFSRKKLMNSLAYELIQVASK